MSGTRRKPGRMGPFVAGFRTSFLQRGYSDLAVRNMLKDVGALGRWMQERDLQSGQLTPAVIAECRSDCLAVGRRKVPSVKSFEPLFRFMRDEGVLGELPEPESPLGRLLVDYRRWLVAERGRVPSASGTRTASPCPPSTPAAGMPSLDRCVFHVDIDGGVEDLLDPSRTHSVLYRPIVVSHNALSSASPTVPTDGLSPSSISASP
jgi:hypothetical protein